jgi:hypothetical protein
VDEVRHQRLMWRAKETIYRTMIRYRTTRAFRTYFKFREHIRHQK